MKRALIAVDPGLANAPTGIAVFADGQLLTTYTAYWNSQQPGAQYKAIQHVIINAQLNGPDVTVVCPRYVESKIDRVWQSHRVHLCGWIEGTALVCGHQFQWVSPNLGAIPRSPEVQALTDTPGTHRAVAIGVRFLKG